MRIDVCPTAADAAALAAMLIAAELQAAINKRGRATVALSGGRTPGVMLRKIASAEVDWPRVHWFQVDERIVGRADERRNMTAIEAALAQLPIPAANLHPMPVDDGSPEQGAVRYGNDLRAWAGSPPCLDVVQLGLGADGHTASLFSGDDALASPNEVAISGTYQGLRRMTLSLKTLNLARHRVWLVTGPSKHDIVQRFLAVDTELVASKIERRNSVVVLDRDASDKQA